MRKTSAVCAVHTTLFVLRQQGLAANASKSPGCLQKETSNVIMFHYSPLAHVLDACALAFHYKTQGGYNIFCLVQGALIPSMFMSMQPPWGFALVMSHVHG